MDDATFWEITDSFDWSKLGDDHAVMRPAIDRLKKLTEADLQAFDEILAQKLYALDTKAHADPTGFGTTHASVDTFLYQRCVAVINGRDYYEKRLTHQEPLENDLHFESILHLTYLASIEMGLDDYFPDQSVSYETFSNEAGWQDTDFPDELPPGHKPKHQR